MRILAPILAIVLLLGGTGAAAAHGGRAEGGELAWSFEWWVLLSLALPIVLYAIGIRNMRRRLGPGRVIGASQIGAFAIGMLMLFIALVSPIDTVADQLFSVHMVQHLLLLFAAPPFLVWSRPAVVFLWAFRSRSRRSIGAIWTGLALNRLMRWLMHPNLVWVLFSGLFIFWHFPKPYAWAVENEAIHTVEHLCFFVSALMFWTIVMEPSGSRRLSYGATLVHVATTAVLASLPGALIVLAQRPLYSVHATTPAVWGLTPMQDQQLAGVIMWVPAGFAYVLAICWLFVKWLDDAERQELKHMARVSTGVLLAVALPVLIAACDGNEPAEAAALKISGNAKHGRALIKDFGCGSCHVVPGVNSADSYVGPPLTAMGRRIYIAGVLRNTPDNLAAWIEHPQAIVPGNAMPDMGITRKQAQDIAAYLFTLR